MVRMLFIDYSSAFNTIVPSKLIIKLGALSLYRVKDSLNFGSVTVVRYSATVYFLTGRPQVVKVGNNTSTSLILTTGAPHGCVLCPLLYSLFTHDCVATHASNSIIKFADDNSSRPDYQQ